MRISTIMIVFLLNGCNINQSKKINYQNNTQNIDYCIDLFEKIIQPNWIHLSKDNFYKGKKEYWEKVFFYNQACFRGKNKSEIENLLGLPNWTSDDKHKSYYSIGENKTNANWHIGFKYNKNNIVASIVETTTFED